MVSWTGDIPLVSRYDYQLFIPATNNTITITGINEQQREGHCRAYIACTNSIESLNLNGSAAPAPIYNDILYLKK
jgi:hypothetical protein